MAEASRHVIGEAGGTELWDGQAPAGEYQRRRLGRLAAVADVECAVALLDNCRLAERGLDAGRSALVEQHRDDLPRRSIAEQLPQRLFVPCDAVAVDQGDKVSRCEAAER